jgi:processed acidic surface protein
MKKAGVLLLTFLLSLGLVSQSVMATQTTDTTSSTESNESTDSTESTSSTENSSTESSVTSDSTESIDSTENDGTSNFDQDLALYINQISFERGFTITKEDIEYSLTFFEESLEDFTSVEEISSFLGDVIQSDYSNLDGIYSDYELDYTSLTALLAEYGEELNDYIYVEELNAALYFYTDKFDRDPNFDQNLVTYLTSVSNERGFEVTKEDIEGILSEYETTTDEFETVDDLSDFLGEVIKKDLSNLDYIYETYDMNKESLLKLLSDKGKNLDDFVYLSQIETFIWTNEIDSGYDEYIKELYATFDKIGITEEELMNLVNYFTSIEEYLSSPEVTDQLTSLMDRIMAYADIPESSTPTEAQINDVISIYKDFLSILKIDIKYTLIKNGKEIPVTIEQLAKMEANDYKGIDLKLTIYGENSQFLLDMVFTNEMLLAGYENIGGVIEDTVGVIDKQIEVKANGTIKGGQLPKTASAYLPNALGGLFLILIGIIMYRKVRKKQSGSTKQE